MKKQIKSPVEVKAQFEHEGISIASWARANHFNKSLVVQVVNGNRRCLRGQSHEIAVTLGMKEGVIAQKTR